MIKQSLELMPGFDKHHWPDLNDLEYATGVYRQWGARHTGHERTRRAYTHGVPPRRIAIREQLDRDLEHDPLAR